MSTLTAALYRVTDRLSRPTLLAALAAVPFFGTPDGTPLGAQGGTGTALTGRFSGSVYGQGSQGRGDFGANTGTGWGAGATGLVRLDASSIINWRADVSFLTYGNSRRRVPLPGTGGLVRLDLRTSNNIGSFVTGPQLLGPTGVFTPYAAALGGFSVFWTESSVEGTQNTDTPFASTTNNNDAALAYGGAAGLYIRVSNGSRPIRLDFGARALRHDDAKYLTDDRVREAFENNRDPVPMRGRADFVTYYAGVHAILF